MQNIKTAQNGFTIIELMVTLVIAGVVFAFALPAYQEVTINNKLAAGINEFSTALLTARSEAVQRNRNVIVCTSSNAITVALPSCNAAVTWDKGWIAYVDLDNDGNIDADEVIRVGNPLDSGYVIDGSANVTTTVTYTPTGEVVNAGSFALCKSADTKYARQIDISLSGRIKLVDHVTTPVTTCTP